MKTCAVFYDGMRPYCCGTLLGVGGLELIGPCSEVVVEL